MCVCVGGDAGEDAIDVKDLVGLQPHERGHHGVTDIDAWHHGATHVDATDIDARSPEPWTIVLLDGSWRQVCVCVFRV